MIRLALGAAACLLMANGASAATVDGALDPSYGLPKSVVTLNPALASYDFQAATPFSESTGYAIYLTSDANAVYGFVQANTTGAGAFSNLYFDLDPANGNGSDIGFEITNDRAFVAGVSGYSGPLAGLTYAISADQRAIEFSIANTLFTSAIAGLDYQGFNAFATAGSDVTLRLSQSFNYTVAGGPLYGPNRLGSVTIGGSVAAVPEPSTWGMMLLGFTMLGASMRYRRRRTGATYA